MKLMFTRALQKVSAYMSFCLFFSISFLFSDNSFAQPNDLCVNATPIVINLPGECPGNSVLGTTAGAANEGEVGGFCENSNPDVFYEFSSGSFSNILLGLSAGTATDLVVSLYDDCAGLDLTCDFGPTEPLSINVDPNTTYYVRVHTNTLFGDPGTFNLCIEGVYNCPDLGGNVGDSCDDGDFNTINDEIVEGCVCQGESAPVPPNDLCSNATPIVINLPGECPGNSVLGTTAGAANEGEVGGFCEPDNQDVFYEFSSGSFSSILLGLSAGTATDLVVSLYDDCAGLDLTCDFGPTEPLSINVDPNTTYYVRVHTNTLFGDPGTFNLCIQGVYDCTGLSANIGDECDDGNINTINDIVTAGCHCEGELLPAPPNDLCSNAQSISVNEPGECPGNAVEGTTVGSNSEGSAECEGSFPDVFYTFNSGEFSEILFTLNPLSATDWVVSIITACDGESILCSFTPDGPLPVSLEPETDYIIRVHYNINFGEPGTFELCIEGVYECPDLGANIGDSCDDGDINTINDTVQGDCTCQGTVAVANNLCENAQSLSVQLPGDCAGNAVAGTTQNSSASGIEGWCENLSPEVFYSFNSGPYSQVIVNLNAGTAGDLVLSFPETCTGPLQNLGEAFCDVGLNQARLLEVEPGQDYLIRVHTLPSVGAPGTFNICVEGVYDCPDLSGNIGDPCDDGNINTINDTVQGDCTCQGTEAVANNLCENAQNLSVQLPGDCSGNETFGTTENASGSDGNFCEPGSPDVYYSFNSGPYSQVVVSIAGGTAVDLVLSILSSCGIVLPNPSNCSFGLTQSNTYDLEANTEYLIRIHSIGPSVAGTFSICVEGVYDCPDLSLNIGDPCDDGDINTINDTVQGDCTCQGTEAVANNLCENAQSLSVQLPGDCAGNAVAGTTQNASASGIEGWCEKLSPEVFYTFNSGPYSNVIVNVSAGTATDLVISFPESCTDPLIDPPFCAGALNISQGLEVEPNQDYIIRIHTNPEFGSPGTFNICVEGVFDCPDLGGNIGDSCNDGDINTINDEIVEGCVCQGEALPTPPNDLCEDAIAVPVNEPGGCQENGIEGTTLGSNNEGPGPGCESDNPDVFYTFNSGNFSEILIALNPLSATDWAATVLTACDGDQVDCTTEPVGPYTVQVTPNTDYVLRIHTNLTFGDPGSFELCLAGVYECPGLGANIGDSCDDGDPGTINDTVNDDCECIGETSEGSLSVTVDVECTETYMVRLYQPGTDNLVAMANGPVNPDGTFTVTGLPGGTYDVFVKLSKHLSKGFPGVVIGTEGASISAGTFIVGDVNSDNGINIQDITALTSAFGLVEGDPGFNPMLDLDCSGGINIQDVTLMISGFGLVGEMPPLAP